MSSDMRRTRRCARLNAAAARCLSRRSPRALDDVESLFDQRGLGSPKYAWTSSSSRRRSSLKHQLRISVAKLPRETPPYPHGRIKGHLKSTAFVISPLGLGRLPLHPQFVERVARRAREAVRAIEDRLAGKLRDDGAAIDAILRGTEGSNPSPSSGEAGLYSRTGRSRTVLPGQVPYFRRRLSLVKAASHRVILTMPCRVMRPSCLARHACP